MAVLLCVHLTFQAPVQPSAAFDPLSLMTMSTYRRVCLATLAVLVPLGGPVIYGAKKSLENNVNSPIAWMPESFVERQQYEMFLEQFESNDVVVVSWRGCTIDDPRLEIFRRSLEQADTVRRPEQRYFSRIISGQAVVGELMDEPLNLDRSAAVARLVGSLIGKDGRTTCAVVVFTDPGMDQRSAAIPLIRKHAALAAGLSEDDVHMAGPMVDAVAVDSQSEESIGTYGPLSGVIILLLGWWCLRSLRVTIVILAMSLYCVAATQALLYYCGDVMNAVLIVMPPLVLVVGVSGGVHLVNYYYDSVELFGPTGAARRALSLGWLPCAMASGTTAIGLASLMVSQMMPIWMFGWYGAAGVLTTLVLLLLLLPGTLELVIPANRRGNGLEPAGAIHTVRFGDYLWQTGIGRLVTRHYAALTVVAVLVMAAAGWGVQHVRTSVKLSAMFEADSRIIRDYSWIEEHVAPLVTIEVLVHFDGHAPHSFLDRMALVTLVEQSLRQMPDVGGTMSAATFAPAINRSGGLRAALVRNTIEKALERRRSVFVDMKFLHEDPQGQTWRVTARVPALGRLDYGLFIDEVRRHVTPVVESGGVSATFTGAMPLVYKAQHALLADLFKSFLWAFALVTLTMVVVQAAASLLMSPGGHAESLPAMARRAGLGGLSGLVAMTPNLFPMVLMFGLMGWLRRPMDIGSVMTASVALGMAFDGTMHFLTFFRRAVIEHGVTDAVAIAFHECAGAMTQSVVICSSGLMVFALSDFVPVSRFAWMMLGLLVATLAGQLLVLPSLLLGPLGRLFGAAERPVAEPLEGR